MKPWIALTSLLVAGFPLLFGCSEPAALPVSSSPTETPAATPAPEADAPAWTIREAELPEGFPAPGPVGAIVVKRYPAYRAAFVAAEEGGRSENGMFLSLFRHIRRNDVSMTAPVRMGVEAEGKGAPAFRSMAFYYRTPETGHAGPDGAVRVEDRPASTVASIGIRGACGAPQVEEALKALDRWLEAHAGEYRRAGEPICLGYNSPFVPVLLRLSEVQVPIERIDG